VYNTFFRSGKSTAQKDSIDAERLDYREMVRLTDCSSLGRGNEDGRLVERLYEIERGRE
jgi:hypothetical protein